MLTKRSQEKELLDLGPDYYTYHEFVECQKMLFRINQLLGFFKDTKRLLKQFSKHSTVLDVGCGAGLMVLHLSRLFPSMILSGTDISLSSITLAEQSLSEWQKRHSTQNVSFTVQDQLEPNIAANSIDVILTTLVCHHLSDEALVAFLQQLLMGAKKAVIINDLHRHYLAEFFYGILSPILFRNRLINHDGLISIRRGFTRKEWETLLLKANIKNYTLKWRFPFSLEFNTVEIAITAIGTANPIYQRTQHDAAELVAKVLNLTPTKTRLLKSVYKATGIKTRYSVLGDYCKAPGEFDFFPNEPNMPFPTTAKRMEVYKENALQLSLQAIENCFLALPLHKTNEITHVITVSCTGMYAPGLDIEIVQSLNLNSDTKRTCINFMGCYGAFNAIKMADYICKSEPHAMVLVVCVELCTLHFQNNPDMSNLISNAIFADGAAAAVIQANAASQKKLVLEQFNCDLLPQSMQEMAWHITDQGFDIVLSSYVPQIIQSGIANFLDRLLTKSQSTLSKIDLYAIHPGGIKILQACEASLNIPPEANQFSYDILRDYGNMSSATILFVLKKMLYNLKLADNAKKVFSCAFGPGLTLESMLLKVKCTV